ncbi:NAD-dependent protein deacetylase sirtuin-7 [Mauremys reevesii]|uniref:NAD-dependent protein deacetylase sirtuin-7 n=1 Tax=Mauremys reevesii TaxID=260615 RepID=UPI00193F91D1|nr:NAD-dependent protein deacetylase sirtuin-7 [Mauremys reevesii]
MAAGGSLSRTERKAAARAEILQQEEQRDRRRQVSRLLKKPVAERNPEESLLLGECEDIVRELERRRKKREGLRRRQEEVGARSCWDVECPSCGPRYNHCYPMNR